MCLFGLFDASCGNNAGFGNFLDLHWLGFDDTKENKVLWDGSAYCYAC